MNTHSDPAAHHSWAGFLDAIAPFASTQRYRRSAPIYSVGDRPQHWYRVSSGIAAACGDLSDGRRQIVELLLPGDFFGFSPGEEHLHAVEAVTDETTIVCYDRRRIEALAVYNPKVERELRGLAFETIRRLQERVVTVGRMNAVEKVGAFLVEIARRTPRDAGGRVSLPLSRYEIADYLGLSMETVSRSIAQLKRKAAISLCGPHRFQLLDPGVLHTERVAYAPLSRAE